LVKLTDEERDKAKKELEDRVEQAIGQSPKGLTDEELCGCVLRGASKAGIVH